VANALLDAKFFCLQRILEPVLLDQEVLHSEIWLKKDRLSFFRGNIDKLSAYKIRNVWPGTFF
jgi:hypothetical protein